MTTRERWIVYPILFMTLGIAMRDKVVPPSHFVAQEIHCGQLDAQMMTVVGPRGKDRLRMGAVRPGAGRIEVCNRQEDVVAVVGADTLGRSGLVQTLGADGFPQTQLASFQGAGVVSTVDQDLNQAIMGRWGPRFGVLAMFPKVESPVFLSRPLHIEMQPQQQKPPAEPHSDANKPPVL